MDIKILLTAPYGGCTGLTAKQIGVRSFFLFPPDEGWRILAGHYFRAWTWDPDQRIIGAAEWQMKSRPRLVVTVKRLAASVTMGKGIFARPTCSLTGETAFPCHFNSNRA